MLISGRQSQLWLVAVRERQQCSCFGRAGQSQDGGRMSTSCWALTEWWLQPASFFPAVQQPHGAVAYLGCLKWGPATSSWLWILFAHQLRSVLSCVSVLLLAANALWFSRTFFFLFFQRKNMLTSVFSVISATEWDVLFENCPVWNISISLLLLFCPIGCLSSNLKGENLFLHFWR